MADIHYDRYGATADATSPICVVLLNTVSAYHAKHKDILPTKGNILDQGSSPSHKSIIIDLYEQGYLEVDIARLTTHNIESVGRYIKTYKDVLLLLEKGFNSMEMVCVTGHGRKTIIQYKKLAYLYHPELDKPGNKGEIDAT